MEVLELKPIKNKKIFVIIIKKNNNQLTQDESVFIKNIIEKYNVNFATITLKPTEVESFKETNLAMLLNDLLTPFFLVDIPSYAMGYLESEIAEKKEKISELEKEYRSLEDKTSFKAENLKSWIEYLKEELQKNQQYVNTKLKAQWIVKKILDIVRFYEDSLYYEDILYIIHFTPEELVLDLKQTLEELGIFVIICEIKKNYLNTKYASTKLGVN
ncbi:MAG: hypothetical protein ACTSRP_17995 [Candidatus Helarchaeota archaeon]